MRWRSLKRHFYFEIFSKKCLTNVGIDVILISELRKTTNKKEVNKMSLVAMRDEVINKYGKDSYQAGYIQYCFSHHETPWFLRVYRELMGERA